MDIDLMKSVAGLIVGVVVGLTGMGGGALMTPILVLFFNTTPAAAVSSDLVASLFMKPIGGTIHWRRATVHRGVVGWLLVGAVPAAFCGVFVLNAIGGEAAANKIKILLGCALLLAVASMVLREVGVRRHQDDPAEGLHDPVRVLPTLVIGIVGGLIVGMTSVGGGSIMIVALMWLYPRLSGRVLVGTSLVQAVPLVGSAALSHVFFGDVSLGVTTSLLIGAIPGVYVGAQISSRTTAPWLRPLLSAVLLASALKLLGAPSIATGVAAVAGGAALYAVMTLRQRRAETVGPEPDPEVTSRDTSSRAHLSEV